MTTHRAFYAAVYAANGRWDRTFEEAYAALEQLPGVYLELDGSFFWLTPDEPRGRIQGNLFDRDGRLLYVDLKADCSAESLEKFLAVIRPAEGLLFELPREGRRMEEAALRAYLESDGP